MTELAAIALFSFVSAVTPGPNNALLLGAGMQFGFRSTLRHIGGISLGIGLMAIAVATGLGLLIERAPWVQTALGVAGSVYLLYLAYRIAGSRALQRPDGARPLTLGQAVAFQFINPKAWVFVTAAIGTFWPEDFSTATATALTAATMMVVVIPSAAVWGAGGAVLQRLGGGNSRTLSTLLALILVGTVAYIWI